MPPLAPTVLESATLEGTAWLVASSARFQTEVGAANQEAALAHVYWPWAEDDGTEQRPRCVLSPGQFLLENKGSQSWQHSGSIIIAFELLPPTLYRDRAVKKQLRLQDFMNRVSTILWEMALNCGQSRPSGQPSYPNLSTFGRILDPDDCEPDNEGGELFNGVAYEGFYK